jgi:hypothetical protein
MTFDGAKLGGVPRSRTTRLTPSLAEYHTLVSRPSSRTSQTHHNYCKTFQSPVFRTTLSRPAWALDHSLSFVVCERESSSRKVASSTRRRDDHSLPLLLAPNEKHGQPVHHVEIRQSIRLTQALRATQRGVSSTHYGPGFQVCQAVSRLIIAFFTDTKNCAKRRLFRRKNKIPAAPSQRVGGANSGNSVAPGLDSGRPGRPGLVRGRGRAGSLNCGQHCGSEAESRVSVPDCRGGGRAPCRFSLKF